jgi:hypothetical protein
VLTDPAPSNLTHPKGGHPVVSTETFDYDEDITEAWPWLLDPSSQAHPAHPLVDADSASVLAQAVAELAVIRCPALGLADALADLYASVSLLHQGTAFLPQVVAEARAQDRSWAEIAAQLQISPSAAQRRYSR